ncbi:hypothetical protein QL285_010823 [Trifolium repens]|nr:hypothetical protein QL285_010823 [Trifolium repens]
MKMVVSSIGCGENKFENNEYESEELGSDDPDASDDERGPKVERYRKGDMHKRILDKTIDMFLFLINKRVWLLCLRRCFRELSIDFASDIYMQISRKSLVVAHS